MIPYLRGDIIQLFKIFTSIDNSRNKKFFQLEEENRTETQIQNQKEEL